MKALCVALKVLGKVYEYSEWIGQHQKELGKRLRLGFLDAGVPEAHRPLSVVQQIIQGAAFASKHFWHGERVKASGRTDTGERDAVTSIR